MTFVDAAIEVLKREGKPLAVKRLAELAVKHNLLSVVGRDPAGTMQDRLDDVFERYGGRHPDLVRVAGDTFGLRAYPPAGSLPPLSGAAPAEDKRNGEPAGAGKRRRRRRGRKGEAPAGAAEASAESGDGEDTDESAGEAAGEAAAGEAAAGETGTATGEAATTGEAAAGARRRRRRRGGRGRRRPGAEGAATASTAPGGAAEAAEGEEGDAGEDDDEGGAADESMGANVAVVDAGGDGEEGEEGEGVAAESAPPARAEDEGEGAAEGEGEGEGEGESDEVITDAPLPDELPSEAEAAGTPVDEAAAAEAGAQEAAGEGVEDELLDEEDLEADIDHDSGPVLAPAHGVEELTRSDEDRAVRPEILGSGREDRHRRDRHRRDRKHDKGKPGHKGEHARGEPHAHKAEHKAEHARGEPHAHKAEHAKAEHPAHKGEHARSEHPRGEHAHAHKPEHPRAEPKGEAGEARGLLDAVLDVLRNGDGRPMHVRHIVEQALKRHLLDSRVPPNELVRQTRVALARELRERENDGLRPRVRALGGGHFGVIGSRLEPELASVEGELAERAARLRDATRAALRRRLGRMSPPAFEALARALCERLGIAGLELVRRGEGVAYYGGQRQSGMTTVKVLVAVRPGEAEINRRAVGELRAGLQAKGCDEGLLFAGGRPAQEALTELKNGPGVTAYDGASLAQLLVRHGLGVRRALVPVEYLDLDFLAELTEA